MFLHRFASQFSVAITSESIDFWLFTFNFYHIYTEFSLASELYDSWNTVHLCKLTIYICTFLIFISDKHSSVISVLIHTKLYTIYI